MQKPIDWAALLGTTNHKVAIKELMEKHHTYTRCADILGVDVSTFCKYARKVGVKSPYSHINWGKLLGENPSNKLADLLTKKSLKQIAEDIGVNLNTLRWYCSKMQISQNKDGDLIVCKCPRCEVIYKRQMYWTGKGMPRAYCYRCQVAARNVEEEYKVWY